MQKQGFTLVELLTTVLIVGILVSVALPMYTRTIERSRATEAMTSIKALNDAIYTFFTDKETCPTRFSQLVVAIPNANDETADTSIATKFFQFDLAGAPQVVPGTDCRGVLATRINGGGYQYQIWNPYTRGTTGKTLALQCAPVADISANDNKKSVSVCKALGLYRETRAIASGTGRDLPGEKHVGSEVVDDAVLDTGKQYRP